MRFLSYRNRVYCDVIILLKALENDYFSLWTSTMRSRRLRVLCLSFSNQHKNRKSRQLESVHIHRKVVKMSHRSFAEAWNYDWQDILKSKVLLKHWQVKCGGAIEYGFHFKEDNSSCSWKAGFHEARWPKQNNSWSPKSQYESHENGLAVVLVMIILPSFKFLHVVMNGRFPYV